MLNLVIISGRLTRDPEKRTTQSGKSVTSLSLACERDFPGQNGTRETDFIDVVCFGQTADFVASYFSKGRMMLASGRLQIRSWQDKDGNKRKSTEVIADRVYFGDSKKESLPDTRQEFTQLPDGEDDELPF